MLLGESSIFLYVKENIRTPRRNAIAARPSAPGDCRFFSRNSSYDKIFFPVKNKGNRYLPSNRRQKDRYIQAVSYTHLDVYKRQAFGTDSKGL